jgi:hypothetical protein
MLLPKPSLLFSKFWTSCSELLRSIRLRHGVQRRTISLMTLLLTLSVFLVSGCTTATKLENSQRLIKHPQFPRAAFHAPDFTREALKTINRLEYELERK